MNGHRILTLPLQLNFKPLFLKMNAISSWAILVGLIWDLFATVYVVGITRNYEFNVQRMNITRLCQEKCIVAVNGQFPGPTILAEEGDEVVVKVNNLISDGNFTIHWHGIRQLQTPWADGPAYITQCPIQPGNSYTYRYTVKDQRGTFFWHAHILWQRATVYGALIVLPKLGTSFPFPSPIKEVEPIILGEWWKADVEAIVKEALLTGGGPNVSDAFTINGMPGPFYDCSDQDTFVLPVDRGGTYLLRIINAALNNELFFTIAGHKMTVVEVDAIYTQPFQTSTIMIAPGQTTSVLITTHKNGGSYYMESRPYKSAEGVPLDNTTTYAILNYVGTNIAQSSFLNVSKANLPKLEDTTLATKFTSNLRTLNSLEHPSNVPQTIDRNLFFTLGLALKPCSIVPGEIDNGKCKGPYGGVLSAAINNISFALPTIALLEAHYFKIGGVFTTNFPDKPIYAYDYTKSQLPTPNLQPSTGTQLSLIPFNSSVQVVLQNTCILGTENHPIHIHGYDVFVVGQGFGNYDPISDPNNFNLIDPPSRNTIAVPKGGWAALRFRANNPGVWLMHCHIEIHLSWGLAMAFLVEDGIGEDQRVVPPPSDLPTC